MSDLLARLVALADCDGRAGEPLGKAMREAAAEIVRLNKHIAIMHDVADQRDTIILERDAKIARMKKDAEDGAHDYLALRDRADELMKERDAVRLSALQEAAAECLDVAASYPDPHEGEIVAARAMIRQSANVAKLCADRIRALAR